MMMVEFPPAPRKKGQKDLQEEHHHNNDERGRGGGVSKMGIEGEARLAQDQEDVAVLYAPAWLCMTKGEVSEKERRTKGRGTTFLNKQCPHPRSCPQARTPFLPS